MSVSVPGEQAFDENGRTEAKEVIVNQVLSENVGIKKGLMVWSCTGASNGVNALKAVEYI